MKNINIDYSLISDVEVDGIDYSDYPDFCDAHICAAWWADGREFTDEELDALNEDSDYVYEMVERFIY